MSKIINDIIVKPVVQGDKYTKKNTLGYDMFPFPYSNVLLQASTKSGKTTVIYNALEKCLDEGTDVFIFAPTVNQDPTYKKMIKMLKKKKCNVVVKEHFKENGLNYISGLLQLWNEEKEAEEKQNERIEEEPEGGMVRMKCGRGYKLVKQPKEDEEPEKPKKKKKKMYSPDRVIILDDLSSDMRDKDLYQLFTRSRHYKLKTFVSCHSINNILPSGLVNIHSILLFPNLSDVKIEELQDKICLYDKSDNKHDTLFKRVYKYATSEPYNFLYIDRENDNYRKNFNKLIDLEKFK